jgi:hypothetical protein
MGYTQETDWNITVPFANLHTLFDGLVVEWTSISGLTELLPDAVRELVSPFGSDNDVGYRFADSAMDVSSPDPSALHIVGWTAGKVSYDDDERIVRLQDAHASGTIDGRGEDGLYWRLRFHGDGRMTEHKGEIVYLGDEEVSVA